MAVMDMLASVTKVIRKVSGALQGSKFQDDECSLPDTEQWLVSSLRGVWSQESKSQSRKTFGGSWREDSSNKQGGEGKGKRVGVRTLKYDEYDDIGLAVS